MAYSLGEPTRIIIDTIEKPSAVLRDEFRELYKLNLFRLENFKYIQGKLLLILKFNIKTN